MMVDGVSPLGEACAAARSFKAVHGDAVAAGPFTEPAAQDRLISGSGAHRGSLGGLERLLAELAQGVVGALEQLTRDRRQARLAPKRCFLSFPSSRTSRLSRAFMLPTLVSVRIASAAGLWAESSFRSASTRLSISWLWAASRGTGSIRRSPSWPDRGVARRWLSRGHLAPAQAGGTRRALDAARRAAGRCRA
jgi:hypothetical protein